MLNKGDKLAVAERAMLDYVSLPMDSRHTDLTGFVQVKLVCDRVSADRWIDRVLAPFGKSGPASFRRWLDAQHEKGLL